LNTQKPVAIKILKAREGRLYAYDKKLALECLQSEIKILESCSHLKLSNVVRIKHASFDGTIVKEMRVGG
jgi:hypothetical protein